MTYPAGVQTATLTFSNPGTFLGHEATRTEVTFQATAGVVWSATGQPIDDFPEVVTPGEGMPGSLTAPFVDQAGFTDQAGNAFTMWAYQVTRKSFYGSYSKVVKKNWQPLIGQDTIDFDNLPGGSIGLPVSTPVPPVTSVAGLTLAVAAEDLAGELVPFLPDGVTPETVEANLPERLAPESLSATYATVFKPEKYGAVGDGVTNDAPAIQAAFDAVGVAGGGTVVFKGGKSYAIASKLTLPAIAPVHLRMETGAQLLATATMTAMIEKPTGGYGSGSIYEGLKLNGGLKAERCLDIQQSQGLKIKSPDLLRFTYAGADFGRTAGQNYELEWTGGAVTGRLGGDAATAAQLADYGIHTGPSGVTDNFFSDIKIKNVKTHVREQGQADVWHMIHCYAYPFANTPGANDWSDGTVQFDVSGYHNRIVSCYIDTAAVGIRVTGSFVRITDCQFLWPSNHTPSYAPVGIDVQAPGTSIIGNAFYPGKPDSQDVTGIKVSATAYRPIIIGNQFGGGVAGYVAGGPMDVNAGAGGTIHGNHWDGGSIHNATNNRTRSTIASDLGDAGHVVQRWYGGNPGQMLAVGSGATGYMRLWQETAGGGFQIGATGNKFGVNGAAPVVTQDANTDLETILSRFGLITAGTVRATRLGLNPRSADTTLTTQAGEVQSVDAIAGPVSLTLPATTVPGHKFTIKKTDGSANAVTVMGTIDGVANYSLPARWNFVTVVSTSTSGSWLIVAKG